MSRFIAVEGDDEVWRVYDEHTGEMLPFEFIGDEDVCHGFVSFLNRRDEAIAQVMDDWLSRS